MNKEQLDRPVQPETKVASQFLSEIGHTLETLFDIAKDQATAPDHKSFMETFNHTIENYIVSANKLLDEVFVLKLKSSKQTASMLSLDVTIAFCPDAAKTYRFFVTAGQIGFRQLT